jgi:hypothetical protein
MMPVDSNLLNSALAISSFCESRAAGFCKNGGVAIGINVMLNPVGRLWQHIPRAQNAGVFLKQEFYISRNRVSNVL